jgi:predicted transcriptional regulator
MKLKKIMEYLNCNCRVLCEDINLDIDIKFAIASDLMSDILATAKPGELLLTGLAHNSVIRTCEITGINAVIFVRNKQPSDDTIKLAQNCKIPVLLTDSTMFEACGILFSKGLKGIHIERAD